MPSDIAPRVSVLMSVYNGEPYLEEAIRSILDQTFADFEFLIIDDGSTDGSTETISRLAREDERIRFKTRENRGLAQTLNELIEMARGEYLARMDADDISLPGRFASQVARLDAEPELGVLGGGAVYADSKGRSIFRPHPPQSHEEIDQGNLVGHASLIHPSVMMRKKVVMSAGGYDPAFDGAEDLELWLRLAERSRLANLPDVVIRYRLVETSISGQRRDEQAALTERACRAAWERRGLPPMQVSTTPWRPGPDHASQRDFALRWGWQAWNSGNQATARRFFFKALRHGPLSRLAWNAILFGALRKRS